VELTISADVHIDDTTYAYIDDAQKSPILFVKLSSVEHLYCDDTFFSDSSIVRVSASLVRDRGANFILRTDQMIHSNTGSESALLHQYFLPVGCRW
jgi:hypothetical protein